MELNKKNKALSIAIEKGYYSKNGIIHNKNKKPLKSQLNKVGYYFFKVCFNGEKVSVAVSRFVAFEKYGYEMFKDGIEVRHLDSNSKNNLKSNIALGTKSENCQDKPKETRLRVSLYASSFIKKHNHNDIIKRYENGDSYGKIMKDLGIKSKGTISFIIKKSNDSKQNKEKLNLQE